MTDLVIKQQMRNLPIDGWFFSHRPINQIKGMLSEINRPDIKLMRGDWILDPNMFRGCVCSGYDIDHELWDLLNISNRRNEFTMFIIEMSICLERYHTSTKKTLLHLKSPPICPCGIDRRDCDYHK